MKKKFKLKYPQDFDDGVPKEIWTYITECHEEIKRLKRIIKKAETK